MQVLAVDLGGTELRAGLVDDSGALVAHGATETDAAGGPEAIVAQIADLVEPLMAGATERVVRLGIAAPGPLDPVAGIVLAAPTLTGWRDVPLSEMLRARLGIEVVLENDANAAALGEWRFGAGRGTQSMAFVTVSTGIGGGVVIDRRLLHGYRGLAAEVGHMSVTQEEVRCVCGGLGCWEAMASGTALARAARRRMADGGAAGLRSVAGDGAISGPQIEAAARAGDGDALALWRPRRIGSPSGSSICCISIRHSESCSAAASWGVST